MLAGLIRDDERRVLSGIIGLSDLPLVGRLFAHNRKESRDRHRPDADAAHRARARSERRGFAAVPRRPRRRYHGRSRGCSASAACAASAAGNAAARAAAAADTAAATGTARRDRYSPYSSANRYSPDTGTLTPSGSAVGRSCSFRPAVRAISERDEPFDFFEAERLVGVDARLVPQLRVGAELRAACSPCPILRLTGSAQPQHHDADDRARRTTLRRMPLDRSCSPQRAAESRARRNRLARQSRNTRAGLPVARSAAARKIERCLRNGSRRRRATTRIAFAPRQQRQHVRPDV